MANPQNLITWQTILLTVSSLNLLKVIETQDSCRGRCASVYDRNSKCHCDSECIRYGECCEDYRTICTSETSCSGRCFEQHERGRKCQCDPSCMNYGDCCSDFVANCEKDTWKNPAFMATTRASLVFTSSTRKPTAEKPEFISDTLPQQDAASFSDDNAKIKEESMKLKNGSAKVSEGSTIINPNRFELGNHDSKISDQEVTATSSSADTSRDSESLDNGMITPSVSKDGTFNSKILAKVMTTSVIPEDGTMDSKTLENRMTTHYVPEDRSTTPKTLNEGIKTTTVPEAVTTNSKIQYNEMSTVIPKDASSDSMPLHKAMTMPSMKVTAIKSTISDAHTTIHSASGQTSSVPDKLDRGTITFPIPEDKSSNSNTLDEEIVTVPESDTLNSKIPNNGIKAPLVSENVSKSSEAQDNKTITPSLSADYSTNSKIMHKGLTTSPIPQDVPTDSKILDKGLTTNTDPEEVTANPRVLESVKTTSALPEAASTNARISGKGMASLSVPVPSPTRSDIMVTEPTHERRNQITGKTQSYEDILNDSNLCNKKPSDAMTTLQNGTTYIFRGHLFWTISQKGQILGHPQRISDVWGIPSPIDTVFTRCNCLGNTYFFKGDQYWRFQNGHMDSGYPRKIAAGFSGLSGEITVALSVAAYRNRPETVYFFKKGGLYQKYVYQRPITSCPLERTHSPIYQVARRYRRQTMVAMQKSRKLQNIAQLSVEMSIRKNWHGFPLTVTSAISIPNPGLPEKYEYYVISHAKSYRVDPVNQKATYMKRSITKDVYKCL
ncbi:proteoglycan 4b isoform X1 [Hypanus sabinus]|uniref:proteoglycan 4b isoform X1 n=1 Tax=Hypanus sabinus TaxID=79690 RepID=UPI0028C44F06|nr:proteoglycan 4b isoform X1 [Hypanus sabinus]